VAVVVVVVEDLKKQDDDEEEVSTLAQYEVRYRPFRVRKFDLPSKTTIFDNLKFRSPGGRQRATEIARRHVDASGSVRAAGKYNSLIDHFWFSRLPKKSKSSRSMQCERRASVMVNEVITSMVYLRAHDHLVHFFYLKSRIFVLFFFRTDRLTLCVFDTSGPTICNRNRNHDWLL
jgi:hypothetical protein